MLVPLQIRWLWDLSYQSYGKVHPPLSASILVFFTVETPATTGSRTLGNLQQMPARVFFIELYSSRPFLLLSFPVPFGHCPSKSTAWATFCLQPYLSPSFAASLVSSPFLIHVSPLQIRLSVSSGLKEFLIVNRQKIRLILSDRFYTSD